MPGSAKRSFTSGRSRCWARRRKSTKVSLSAVTDICYCEPPTDRVKAEVVALLMKKECRDHGIELSNVDPEILATQVIQLDDASGFRLAPQRVKKLLRKPLVAAAPERPPSLSLRVRTPATARLRN